jgi:hypothetical protein
MQSPCLGARLELLSAGGATTEATSVKRTDKAVNFIAADFRWFLQYFGVCDVLRMRMRGYNGTMSRYLYT